MKNKAKTYIGEKILLVVFAVFAMVIPLDEGWAKARARAPQRNPGSTTIEKPLKVTGQTRTLSMLLVLKNKKDKSDFIKVRQHYRNEILNTRF